jgi:hypothetical protein
VVPPAAQSRGLRGKAPRVARAARGVTLLELAITVTFMTIAFGAVVSTLTASIFLSRSNSENHEAFLAACSVIERLRSTRFDQAFAAFNADPSDDPGGSGTAFGDAFDVTGLTPQADDVDGRVGEILFPGGGFVLRENVVDARLGLPRDLDGDGAIDGADHADDYQLLPVVVRVSWRGESGERALEFTTLLAEMP